MYCGRSMFCVLQHHSGSRTLYVSVILYRPMWFWIYSLATLTPWATFKKAYWIYWIQMCTSVPHDGNELHERIFFVHPSWPDGVFSKLWINRYSRISPEIRIEPRCSAITILSLHDWTKRLLMMWTLYYRYSPVIAPVSANILARFHHGAGLR